MEIKIIYQNNDFLIINKPTGIIVHQGAGETGPTIVDWIIINFPKVKKFTWPDSIRPGIVHRLDKDTSGLMVLAKNPEALEKLQQEFQNHRVIKKYLVLVLGKLEKKDGEITSLIGRDPNARRQQVSRSIFFDFESGKKREAKTYYLVLKEYQYHDQALSLVQATLKTGRTHQIRVQFKSIGHPVIGDQTYNTKISKKVSKDLGLSRQFLHSFKLEFDDKIFESKLPQDLNNILTKLS